MARTQKYTEELLLEAVVRYAEIQCGKIKATELAAWACENIAGLEGVRDYHFMRPVREKDLRTGTVSRNRKPCTLRMEEINRARSLTEQVSRNPLLNAATVDAFMDQPGFIQRRQILETREAVDRLIAKNGRLMRTNETIRAENKRLCERMEGLTERLRGLEDRQSRLMKQVTYLMKAADEKARKAALADMGVSDGTIDLDSYAKSLKRGIDDAMDLEKILRRFLIEEANTVPLEENRESQNTLVQEVLSGLSFSGGTDEAD